MTNVSKKLLGRKLEDDAWSRLLAVAKKSPSGAVLKSNLAKFLTASEITMLEKRLAIPLLLSKGSSYRNIGETLDVSSVTISFVKHNLTKKPRVRRKYSPWPKPEPKNDWSSIGPLMTPREHARRIRRKIGL